MTRDEAIADLFAYIEPFYNRSRANSTLAYKVPTQFLHDWITNQHERNLRHEALRLEDEKPREPQFEVPRYFVPLNLRGELMLKYNLHRP